MRLEKNYDLCMMDMKTGEIKVIKKQVSGSIVPSSDDKFLFILSGGSISKISTSGATSAAISFSGDYEYRPKAERAYLFDHVWKQVEEKFYDPQLHGIDWAGIGENYRQFLPYINNDFDFQELLSEMLGELNGSHTGARAYYRSKVNMGRIGVLFDTEYDGEGLRIAEVLRAEF
jgi:hypothetical protein